MAWGAGYATAVELTREFINLVLSKFLLVLRAQNQHTYSANLGFFGNIDAEITRFEIKDLLDSGVPGGGVLTDFEAEGTFRLRLFNLFNLRSNILFTLNDVSIDFTATQTGLPRSLVASISPRFSARVSFPQASAAIRWLLNGLIGPLISFGIWLTIRVIRKIEIPIWELVDIFAAIGLRFTPGSPLLTSQQITPLPSLLVASSFNLTQPLMGNPNLLQSFIPTNTNVGAVVHERIVAAGVQLAFAKGWVPTQFQVSGWKININSISVQFIQDKIIARGSLKAKRGSCWCKVKVRIQFKAAVEPKITNTSGPNPQPTAIFNYDADINVHISTSGMLVVLGAIMMAPLFFSMTIAMSVLINLVLDKFLPFTTSFQIQGGNLTVKLNAVNFTGFIPFVMVFPLQLTGQGTYDLSRFQQFTLAGGVQVGVGFTDQTIALQPEEMRVAVKLT